MAANNGTSKRIPIKWIRDRAKAAYDKKSCCYICGSQEDLELHHTHGLTNLYEKWIKDKGYTVNSDEDIIALRDEFISDFHKEIYEDVFTLCLKHHRVLHSIYGKSPLLHTASKQAVWINRQKDKFNGMETPAEPQKLGAEFGAFARFRSAGEIKPGTSSNSPKSGFASFY